MTNQALSAVKVVGFVTAAVGPLLVRSLAINGATCILIESINRPIGLRTSSPYKDNKPGVNRSYNFAFTNSDKYDMCIDLKHPRAKEVTGKLIQWADILVDNWRPGVMERWGLSYEEVRVIKPDIIMVSSTQQGHTGPYRTVAALGPHLEGYVGLVDLAGWPDMGPISLHAYPDLIAPRFAVTALLAALDYKRRTGKGQFIDVSQFECSIQYLIPAILEYTANKRIMTRNGNKCSYAAPHGVYRCKGDDKWCGITVFTESEWEAFCEVIDNPVWTQEARFSTLEGRKEHEDELNQLVEEWTVEHAAEEIRIMMQQAGVRAGEVRNMGEVIENCPQLECRHYWWRLENPEMGKTLYPGSSYILSKTPYQLQRPAPILGEHTEYICRQFLGMSDEEFVDLDKDGVFQ
jgi:benzylsuccinate CoA-transferase BbsF subunit